MRIVTQTLSVAASLTISLARLPTIAVRRSCVSDTFPTAPLKTHLSQSWLKLSAALCVQPDRLARSFKGDVSLKKKKKTGLKFRFR